MIDGPNLAVFALKTMAPFAVGIVDDVIKESHLPEIFSEVRNISHIEIMGFVFGFNKELNCAYSVGPVTQNGRWNTGPAQNLPYQITGKFSQREGPVWKIPEGMLSLPWLINS